MVILSFICITISRQWEDLLLNHSRFIRGSDSLTEFFLMWKWFIPFNKFLHSLFYMLRASSWPCQCQEKLCPRLQDFKTSPSVFNAECLPTTLISLTMSSAFLWLLKNSLTLSLPIWFSDTVCTQGNLIFISSITAVTGMGRGAAVTLHCCLCPLPAEERDLLYVLLI